MAKKLMYEYRIYDYTSKEEAEKHMEEMRASGWLVKESYQALNSKYDKSSYYKWTVEYHR